MAIADERPSPLRQALASDDEPSSVTGAFAVLLHAVDRFYGNHKRYPGTPVGVADGEHARYEDCMMLTERCRDKPLFLNLWQCSIPTSRRVLSTMTEDALTKDALELQSIAQSLLSEAGIPPGCCPVLADAAAELTRWGGSELHCVAAILGSIASQEAIKLLTAQFVPVEGTLVYNAVHCTSLVLG